MLSRQPLTLPSGLPTRSTRKPLNPILLPNHPMNMGLLACWPLGEGGVIKNVTDIGPRGFNAAMINFGTTNARVGSHHGGMALNFNGSSTSTSTSNTPVMANPWTLSAWVNITTLSNLQAIISFNAGAANGVYLSTTTTVMKIASNGETPNQGTTVLSTGKWYLFGMAWDGTKLNAYLNGNFEYNVTPGGSNWKTAVNTKFGTTIVNGSFFSGSLDMIRIYQRFLSLSEWGRLYAEPYVGITERQPYYHTGVSVAASTFTPPGIYQDRITTTRNLSNIYTQLGFIPPNENTPNLTSFMDNTDQMNEWG